MTELLVGTKKGLFVLEGEPGGAFSVTARAFAGEPVEYALRDPRSGRLLASVTSAFYGPKLWYADDAGGEWEQASGVALPEGGESALERIWTIVPRRPRRDSVRGWRSGRAVRESRRRRHLGAQSRAVGASDAAEVAAGRRRPVPALDRHVARRAGSTRDSDLGGGDVANRRRRGELAEGQPGAHAALPARRHARGRGGPLRSPRAPLAGSARADVHAVPRRRVPLGRRRRVVARHRPRPAVGLRLPARDRPGRPRLRVRDPARRPTPTASRPTAACACTRRATPEHPGRRAAKGCRRSTPT